MALHVRYVQRAIELSASAKLNPVLGIQLDHLHLALKTGSCRLENLIQNAGIEKERWAQIELVALGLDARGASANDGQSLQDFYSDPGAGQEDGRRQAPGAGANDDYLFGGLVLQEP